MVLRGCWRRFLSFLALPGLTLLLVLRSRLGQLLLFRSRQSHTSSRSGSRRQILLCRLGSRHCPSPRLAKSVCRPSASLTRNRAARAAFIFPLEGQRCTLPTGSRGPVGTDRLGWHLFRAQIRRGGRVWSRKGLQRIPWRVLGARLRSPENIVQLVHIFIVHQSTADVPEANAVVNAQSRTGRSRQDETLIRRPFAHTGVRGFHRSNFGVVLLHVENVHLTGQVTKSSHQHKSPIRRKQNSVARSQGEGVLSHSTEVEDGGLGRHITVHDTKFLGVGRPGNVMDWSLLVCFKKSANPACSNKEKRKEN